MARKGRKTRENFLFALLNKLDLSSVVSPSKFFSCRKSFNRNETSLFRQIGKISNSPKNVGSFRRNFIHDFSSFISADDPPEASFSGLEFLSYNLRHLDGQKDPKGEPILSNQDEISLHFRTNRKDGILFYTGK